MTMCFTGTEKDRVSTSENVELKNGYVGHHTTTSHITSKPRMCDVTQRSSGEECCVTTQRTAL